MLMWKQEVQEILMVISYGKCIEETAIIGDESPASMPLCSLADTLKGAAV